MKKTTRIVHWTSGWLLTSCGIDCAPGRILDFVWEAKDRRRVNCGNCKRSIAAKRKKGRRA